MSSKQKQSDEERILILERWLKRADGLYDFSRSLDGGVSWVHVAVAESPPYATAYTNPAPPPASVSPTVLQAQSEET